MNLIFIDTNVLLRFFDSNHKVFKKWLDELLNIRESLFITKQIVDEVERNKLSVFQASINNYKSKMKLENVILPEHLRAQANQFDVINWNKKRKEIEQKNSKLLIDLKAIFVENIEKISSSQDNVSIKLKKIFINAIKETNKELLNAKKRKETGNPPGKHNDSLGDQINWEQFLNQVKSQKAVWIISNDFDFFTQYNKQCYLNPFLKTELLNLNPSLKIYCFNTLSDGLKSFFKETGKKSILKNEQIIEMEQEEIKIIQNEQNEKAKQFNLIDDLLLMGLFK